MIAIVKGSASEEQLGHFVQWIANRGLKTDVSRGEDETIVGIIGDTTQIDLPDKQKSGLVIASRILRKVNDIAICEFTNRDVVRHKLVQDIIRAYEAAEQKQAHRKPEHTDRKDAGKH